MIPVLHGVWAAAGGLVGDFEHIETQTVGAGGAASITFSSIPGTYKHLQVRGIARTTYNATTSYLKSRANSDSGNNYANHGLYGDGASAGSYALTTTDHAAEAFVSGNNATASIFGGFVYDVLDYANTSKNKTFRALTGSDLNGSGQLRFASGVWLSTNAITSLTFLDGNGGNLAQYSSFSLYGVK